MSERFASLFPLLLLAVLAGITWWLDQALQGPPVRRDAILRHDPDYFVEKLTAVRMDTSGAIKYTLRAAKMVHYPDDDTTHLALPDMISHGARAPVTINAKEGLISSNGENIYFSNNVVATRAAYVDRSEMKFASEYLHVMPEENIAITDRPVTITDANSVVRAVGLEFNSETLTLKLHSQVRGSYFDPKRK
jgi:lipopolysaccharide export system protein LptC